MANRMLHYYKIKCLSKEEKMDHSLKEEIIKKSEGYPAKFKPGAHDGLQAEFIIAKRKAFLSTQTLSYKCALRIDEEKKEVLFFEVLFEKSSGLSGGAGLDTGPGMGFQRETYRIGGAKRDATIEEQSNLFGKKYDYEFEYGKIRKDIEKAASVRGYAFRVVLNLKNVT